MLLFYLFSDKDVYWALRSILSLVKLFFNKAKCSKISAIYNISEILLDVLRPKKSPNVNFWLVFLFRMEYLSFDLKNLLVEI